MRFDVKGVALELISDLICRKKVYLATIIDEIVILFLIIDDIWRQIVVLDLLNDEIWGQKCFFIVLIIDDIWCQKGKFRVNYWWYLTSQL